MRILLSVPHLSLYVGITQQDLSVELSLFQSLVKEVCITPFFIVNLTQPFKIASTIYNPIP
jgi:hypothetical protein